ncbi:MAG: SRPBCC family protein [Candidatus Nitrosocaldus sp.]
MGSVSSSVHVKVDKDTAFKFIADPKNIELVYPESLRFRVLEAPEHISDGSMIKMEARLLGQRFEWYSMVRDYRDGISFTDEAIGSPFILWKHTHTVRDSTAEGGDAQLRGSNEGCIIDDRIVFRTVLGPIGDRFAERMISNILEYRNHRIKEVLEGSNSKVEVKYKDTTVISLAKGSALCIAMTMIGLLIPMYSNFNDSILFLISNALAWFLLWFFTHDLLHLIVGVLVGVRFSHFYIGISNLVKAFRVSPKYRMLFIALGIKIDREGSRASKYGYASMYIAGPLASMLIPFYVPLYMISLQGVSAIVMFFLTLSVINLVVDAIMSSRHGCIRKGVRALTKP